MALRKTLSFLRTNVRSYLDESTPGYWTNAQLNQYINEAKDRVQTEVQKEQEDFWDIIRTSLDGTVTLASGDSFDCSLFRLIASDITYSVPKDVREIRTIRCVTSGYEWVSFFHRKQNDPDFRGARAMVDPVSPATLFWDLYGESGLLVVPKIDTTLDLELTYTPVIPDLVNDSDTLEMPHPLYIAVQEYATASAMMMDSSPNAAAWEAKGNASIARFLGATQRQSQDVTVVRGYGEEFF